MEKLANIWKIEMHGGSQVSRWHEVGRTARRDQAIAQGYALISRARQGGVRVWVGDGGYVAAAWWLRHASGARPIAIAFCIGCGCDDVHACMGEDCEPCAWVAKDGSVGLCSSCAHEMPRWRAGDRTMKVTL